MWLIFGSRTALEIYRAFNKLQTVHTTNFDPTSVLSYARD